MSVTAGGGFAYYLRDVYLREEAEREYAEFLPERVQENEEEGEGGENPNGEENANDKVDEAANETDNEVVQPEQEIMPNLPESVAEVAELPKPPENVPQYDLKEIISEMMQSDNHEVELLPSDSNETTTDDAKSETNDNLKDFFPEDVETIDQIMESLSPDSEESALEVENQNDGNDKILSDLAAEMLGDNFPVEKILKNEPVDTQDFVSPDEPVVETQGVVSTDETPKENSNFAGFVGLPTQSNVEESLNILAQLTNDMVITTSTIQEIPKESITATYSLPLITKRKRK